MKAAFDRTGAICELVEEEALPAPTPVVASPRPPTPAALSAAPSETKSTAGEPPAADFACPKCGFSQQKGESCVKCGVFFTKLASRMEQDMHSLHTQDAPPSLSDMHAKRWAMLCHLSIFSGVLIPFGNILDPLSIWLWKRKQSQFVDWHGKIALNYQLTLLLFSIGCGTVAAFSGIVLYILGPIFTILSFYTLFVVIASAVKAKQGDYPEITLSAVFIK